MILRNGEIVDINSPKKTDPILNQIKKNLDEAKKKFKFPVLIQFGKSVPPGKPGLTIATEVPVEEKDGGSNVWRYARSKTDREKGKRTLYSPNGIEFNGSLSISENEMDLFYFLYCLSPQCENGMSGKTINDRHAMFRFVNPENDSREKLTVGKAKNKSLYWIAEEEELSEAVVDLLIKDYSASLPKGIVDFEPMVKRDAIADLMRSQPSFDFKEFIARATKAKASLEISEDEEDREIDEIDPNKEE